MNEEQKQALDATADERGAALGQPHVADGAQPYHADALTPAEHVPGSSEVSFAGKLIAVDEAPAEPSEPVVDLPVEPLNDAAKENEAANG